MFYLCNTYKGVRIASRGCVLHQGDVYCIKGMCIASTGCVLHQASYKINHFHSKNP